MWLVPTAARARFYADPAVGLAIALTVLASALPLIRRSGEVLLQSAPAGVRLEDVRADMERVDGVVSVHELRTFLQIHIIHTLPLSLSLPLFSPSHFIPLPLWDTSLPRMEINTTPKQTSGVSTNTKPSHQHTSSSQAQT
jgi:hypothetical protein